MRIFQQKFKRQQQRQLHYLGTCDDIDICQCVATTHREMETKKNLPAKVSRFSASTSDILHFTVITLSLLSQNLLREWDQFTAKFVRVQQVWSPGQLFWCLSFTNWRDCLQHFQTQCLWVSSGALVGWHLGWMSGPKWRGSCQKANQCAALETSCLSNLKIALLKGFKEGKWNGFLKLSSWSTN